MAIHTDFFIDMLNYKIDRTNHKSYTDAFSYNSNKMLLF